MSGELFLWPVTCRNWSLGRSPPGPEGLTRDLFFIPWGAMGSGPHPRGRERSVPWGESLTLQSPL